MQARIALSFLLLGCTPGSTPPVTSMVVAAPAETATAAPSVAPDIEKPVGTCDGVNEIVVTDGAEKVTYRAGRELVENERGAKVPFAEIVIHPGAMTVFHAEGIANGDPFGSVALSAVPIEPSSLTGNTVEGSIEYTRPGSKEVAGTLPIHFDRFGAVGQLAEGTAGPAELKGKTISARFHVCRTKDWVVRK